MTPLPIDDLIPAFLDGLRTNRSAVVVAEPGAGKTTRVPPALALSPLLRAPNDQVIVLQPRRVAARSTAARIADERGWRLGHEVGYHVRFERVARRSTRLLVMTEGLLTRRMVDDPYLEGVGAVVLDEFHERNLPTDLAIAMLREIRSTVRDDLIVVVMSATLDAEPVARFLGDAPIHRAQGRAFPVEIVHEPDHQARISDRVADVLDREVAAARGGHTLVFLPGMEEIRRTESAIRSRSWSANHAILPLHGTLPAEAQDLALRPSRLPKIVLATNVAETSITIDGVTTVVDSGLVRQAHHDPARGLDRLDLMRISQASADQRAGRAGRTGPGRCVRLWSDRTHRGLPRFDTPEIARVDLTGTVLALEAWGGAEQFEWFEAPPATAIESARRLLVLLGAIDGEKGGLTALGREMLTLPVAPRLARLLVDAQHRGMLEVGASLAALLSEKDIVASSSFGALRRPHAVEGSDLALRLDLLDAAEAARFPSSIDGIALDSRATRNVSRVRRELLRAALHLEGPENSPAQPSVAASDLGKLVLAAYPDRVARRRAGRDQAAVMVGGRGIRIAPESVVTQAELFVALDARDDSHPANGRREALVRIASAIERPWLEELMPGAIQRETELRFDPERRRVVAYSVTRYLDLILREDPGGEADPASIAQALAEGLRSRARVIFESDQNAATWLARVASLHEWLPDDGWPTLDDEALLEPLTWACQGRRSEEEILRSPLVPWLEMLMPHEQRRRLDLLAPDSIVVPSGNSIRLKYQPGGPPILAVRLQEMFGCHETPRVAGGRVAVLLHLLAPNFRPVQVTHDLRSFWATTYQQVRKDLRGRYPKHAWPEDPWTAQPEAKGARRPPIRDS